MSEIVVTHGKDSNTSLTIHTCGATVISWKVAGDEKIFVSTLAKKDGSKAIRGGIPLCFPQFGPWDNGPQHGFARNSSKWELREKKEEENGDVSVIMVLTQSADTKALWSHDFVFTYTVTLTPSELKLNASVENKGESDFDLTFCFHTYLCVKDISKAKVKGLHGLSYIDKTQDGKLVQEENTEVTISGFVDRVYKSAPNCVEMIVDEKKAITLTKENLEDYVVWNPWIENCKKMGDMDDDAYLHMICVEAAQASQRSVVKAGSTWVASHTLESSNHQ